MRPSEQLQTAQNRITKQINRLRFQKLREYYLFLQENKLMPEHSSLMVRLRELMRELSKDIFMEFYDFHKVDDYLDNAEAIIESLVGSVDYD